MTGSRLFFFRRITVRRSLLTVLGVVCLVSLAGPPSRAAQTQTAPGGSTSPSLEDILKMVRTDLQSNRADIIAKNLTLTSEQAAKFWPMFDTYQKEQNAIMDEQMKGIQRYVDGYNTLDDAAALALMQAHLQRDTQMDALRLKWLPEFQKVLPTKLVVRMMQIDRRLSLVHQIEFSSRIPLAQ